MQVKSVQVGKVTLTVGQEVERPATAQRTLQKRDPQTGTRREVVVPAQPAARFKIEAFDLGTGGVRCRDAQGSQLSLDAATAVAWLVRK